jgi:plasmid stabilization system protein ParE
MTRRFIVRPRAERDIQSAYEWYESQEPGLGERFLEAVQKRLEAIRGFPESCPISIATCGERSYRGFPTSFSMWCNPVESQVTVLAVLHHSRSPATWPRR